MTRIPDLFRFLYPGVIRPKENVIFYADKLMKAVVTLSVY